MLRQEIIQYLSPVKSTGSSLTAESIGVRLQTCWILSPCRWEYTATPQKNHYNNNRNGTITSLVSDSTSAHKLVHFELIRARDHSRSSKQLNLSRLTTTIVVQALDLHGLSPCDGNHLVVKRIACFPGLITFVRYFPDVR